MYVFFLRYILNSSDSLSLLVQILYVKPENGHKNLHSYARVLNMEAPKRAFTGIYRYLFFFFFQLLFQACCTYTTSTCPTTASGTSSTACWRTSTSCGPSSLTTTHGPVTTTSTTWSTGSSSIPVSPTGACSAPIRQSSGAGGWKIMSRPTTGNVPSTNRQRASIMKRQSMEGPKTRSRG